jgi:hypothetical protein
MGFWGGVKGSSPPHLLNPKLQSQGHDLFGPSAECSKFITHSRELTFADPYIFDPELEVLFASPFAALDGE